MSSPARTARHRRDQPTCRGGDTDSGTNRHRAPHDLRRRLSARRGLRRWEPHAVDHGRTRRPAGRDRRSQRTHRASCPHGRTAAQRRSRRPAQRALDHDRPVIEGRGARRDDRTPPRRPQPGRSTPRRRGRLRRPNTVVQQLVVGRPHHRLRAIPSRPGACGHEASRIISCLGSAGSGSATMPVVCSSASHLVRAACSREPRSGSSLTMPPSPATRCSSPCTAPGVLWSSRNAGASSGRSLSGRGLTASPRSAPHPRDRTTRPSGLIRPVGR